MELYYDILNAIATEITMEYEVKPTRVQLRSNLAYDKLARYLDELKGKGMIGTGSAPDNGERQIFFTGLRQDCQFCPGDGNKVPEFIRCGK